MAEIENTDIKSAREYEVTGTASALLEGMQSGTFGKPVWQFCRNWPTNHTPKYLLKGSRNVWSHNLHTDAFNQHYLLLAQTVSIWLDEQIVIYPYNEILLSNKKWAFKPHMDSEKT